MKFTLSKHTYIFIALAVVSGFLALASSVFAQTDTTINMTAEEQARTMDTPTGEAPREARRAALSTAIQDRVINLTANVTKRFEAAIKRLDNIIARLETRIDKLQALGVVVEPAEARLAQAKNSLDAARAALEGLDSVQNAIRGDAPRDAFRTIRAQFMEVLTLIKQTHAYLRETVALLREAVRDADLTKGVSSAVEDTTSAEPAE